MTSEESTQLYVLFLMHARGERLVEHTCPNCGSMPHVKKKVEDNRITFTCLQCQCVSSTIAPKETQ